MKIYSMTATFGKLENKTLTLQPGLNVIEAPNEWGKSTWCAFLTTMLYGLDTKERTTLTHLAVKEQFAPWSGVPMAGRIDLSWKGRDITIERISTARIPMGEFKAYETASGVPVPELTGDNCGKMLLGVEKSVFVRTGFIRLADMPVTQDEALRRRLNELVTTGDESGQSDDLAEKLNNLKNKVHLNRSKGLVPQALAEKEELERKLQQLDSLQAQAQTLQQRQAELSAQVAQLRNHKNALAWAAAESRIQKLEDARKKLAEINSQVAILEKACAELPDEATLQAQLNQVKELQNRKDALQLEFNMLPAAPVAPSGLTPMDPEQARKDFEAYQNLSNAKAPGKGLLGITAIGALALLAGILLIALTGKLWAIGLIAVGLVAAIVPLVLYSGKNKTYRAAEAQRKAISDRYAPLPADQWISAAENYVNQNNAYQAALAAYDAKRTDLQQRLQQTMAEIAAAPATEGHSAAMEKRRQLADALRDRQNLQTLVQGLETGEKLPEQPTEPDDLTFTEAETLARLSSAEQEAQQLHNRQGQIQGQMESLGSAVALQAQLTAVSDRLARLEQTKKALELAQKTLEQATMELQRKFAPTITAKARDHFARITNRRYDKLTLTQDFSVEAATADEPATRRSMFRSDGTVDQLYLSLRLAVAEALNPEAPLVLDDALVRFDDTRLAETMALLKEVSATSQVILFTCQNRETKHA